MIKEITNDDLSEALSKEVSFVDFYANWCNPCKMMHPVIDKMSDEYTKVSFYKVDVDKNQNLAREYKIMSIPMMIIFKKGEITKKFLGLTSKEEIIKEF